VTFTTGDKTGQLDPF